MHVEAEIKYSHNFCSFLCLWKFRLSVILSCLYLVNVHQTEGTRHIHTSREKIVGVSNWLCANAHYHIDPLCVCVVIRLCVSQHSSFYSPFENSKPHCKQCRQAL